MSTKLPGRLLPLETVSGSLILFDHEGWRMRQIASRQGGTIHLWIASLTILVLLVAYLVEMFIIWPGQQASAGRESSPLPMLSPPGGYYDQDTQIKITVPGHSLGRRNNPAVIFTRNGSTPTRATGTLYTQPIHLSGAAPAVTVVRACAVLPNGELGPVTSASYFVGVEATLPIVSLIIEPDALWHLQNGICANPYERGDAWERPVDITFLDQDRRSGFHLSAGIRIHGGMARGDAKKSFRLYFRREYGPDHLEYPLFQNSDVHSFKRLVLHTSGQDWCTYPHTNWALMRSQVIDQLALELGGYAAHSRPALVFINGEPWGIYHIRERIDRYFLRDHYGVQSADFLDSPENVMDQAIKMGDREHWDHLLRFVESHDLADEHNYAHVQSQVDIANLTDYFILQIYAANTDWPHNNMQLFRPRVQGGRWHWVFWDCDYCLGAVFLSRFDTDMIARVLHYNHPETGGRNALLLRKLLENPGFLERFLSRTADLLNTTLTSQSVIAHIDAVASELEPDIAYETARWSSMGNIDEIAAQLGLDVDQEIARWVSPTSWESNVADLRQFAQRRPDFVRRHLVESFGLDGTAHLTINLPADGSGTVTINETLILDSSWQGVYFQGVPIQVAVAPAPGYRFAGWEQSHLPQTPSLTLEMEGPQTLTPRFSFIGE
ncbi:MAG: hypothetical protein DRJ03_24700 [Chloroflexi bacterium]|nr:MAG: hypothetical protein DRJ03_24700 [Chloroflexota bacterium]